MSNFIEIGKKIYDLNNPREMRRFIVFLARCYLNSKKIKTLEKFFAQDKILAEVAEKFPFVFEQAPRAFFYNKSNFDERINLIEEHFKFLLQTMTENFLPKIYGGEKILLWQMPLDETLKEMRLILCVQSGDRKEGLMTVILELADGTPIYKIMFWISENAMWIGALQGPNIENSKDLIKILTKKCHAYRTKNLILYAAQAVARAFDLQKIFAVTNYGYYANNHVRTDRKLKTSFSDFWQECGGNACEDKRFFELPMTEYRRRFALLDEIDAAIFESLKNFKR